MQQTRELMGMPITVEVIDRWVAAEAFDEVFGYFEYVDAKFSTYKDDSEISRFNRGEISTKDFSKDMRTIFALAEESQAKTNGYFNILHNGKHDPSGIVKGWAIRNAAGILREKGYADFYVEAGGDIQASGKNGQGEPWRVGIRNPFNLDEIVKVLSISEYAVATSGTYVRGQHIYNPLHGDSEITDIVSLTVVGADICEADLYATAAFAMGTNGIQFIEELCEFEGYSIDKNKMATFTSGFQKWVLHA